MNIQTSVRGHLDRKASLSPKQPLIEAQELAFVKPYLSGHDQHDYLNYYVTRP